MPPTQSSPGRWCHCICTTYGSWLPGDPRGFRTRRHREHVEGDYRRPPPPGIYDQRHAAARGLFDGPAVRLCPDARRVVAEAVRATLIDVHRIELTILAVGATHLHLLARFPLPRPGGAVRDRDPVRHFVGLAKERSAKALIAADLHARGRLWGRRAKIVPIRDRAHQVNVFRYIERHAAAGAVVWDFRRGFH